MIVEELEEIDLCDAYEKRTLMIGDVYKVVGGGRYYIQYWWTREMGLTLKPSLFGIFIKPRKNRKVVCLGKISPKRMRGGKGYFLDRERLKDIKFFLLHKQINSDTGEIYYDRASRMVKK